MELYNPDLQLTGLSGLKNSRDLGGMPTSDGRIVRRGVFVRSDSPADLNAEQIQNVLDYGVKTVIDLRAASELKRYGNPFMNRDGVNFYSIPLFLGDPESKTDSTMNYLKTHILGDFYVMFSEELGTEVVKVIRILLNSDGLCLYHCAHGKDRTGVITAIIYLLAGVSRENIIENYRISYEYMKWLLDPLIEKQEDSLKHTLRSDAENMVMYLDYIDSKYDGNIENYLIKYGMTSEEITKLKKKILE